MDRSQLQRRIERKRRRVEKEDLKRASLDEAKTLVVDAGLTWYVHNLFLRQQHNTLTRTHAISGMRLSRSSSRIRSEREREIVETSESFEDTDSFREKLVRRRGSSRIQDIFVSKIQIERERERE